MPPQRFAWTFTTILFCLFVFEKAQAQANPFETGLVNYQNKKFAEAKTSFEEALKNSPADAAVLTNLGLTTYQLGQRSWSIAYFRKALSLNPSLPAANQGLAFVLPQLEVKEIPHQIETYELIREKFLEPAGEYSYFWILAGLIFLLGWSLIRYFGQRKRADADDLAYPPFPWIAVVAGFLGLIFFFLALAKIYDTQIPRGTVIEEKVSAQSAPGENQLSLFDLYGGFEVVIRSQSGDWVQVTYPGALTGWIQKTSLYVTSGGSPW